MKIKLVIDTSVYITYAVYNKIYRLVNAIDTYNLEVFINDELITECENNIRNFLKNKDVDTSALLDAIKEATIYRATQQVYKNSPDPKDNFLFDLALQTESEVIVTQEKVLLNFLDSPVPIRDLKWFKENYPVPL